MVNLHRIALVVLIWLVLALLSLSASAAGTYDPKRQMGPDTFQALRNNGEPIGGFTTAQAACAANATDYGPDGQGNYRSAVISGAGANTVCTLVNNAFGLYTVRAMNFRAGSIAATCDYGEPSPSVPGTLTGETCACVTPLNVSPTNQSCVNAEALRCSAKNGKSAGNYSAPHVSGESLDGKFKFLCDGGCGVEVNYDFAAGTSSGSMQKTGSGKYTGATCTPDPNSDGTAPGTSPTPGEPGSTSSTSSSKNGCPPGQFPAPVLPGFTGSICIPLRDAASTEGTKETTSTTTDSSGQPITQTKQEKTTCTGSVCTTTTTTTTMPPAGGSPTSTTDTKTESKDDVCVKNPRSPLCVTSVYGDAACGASQPTCDGDAIQCGIAKLSWQTACALNPPDSPEKAAYTAAATAAAADSAPGSALRGLPNKTTLDMNNMGTLIDQSPHFAASSGQQDLTLTIAGNQVTFELSRVNTWLDILGNMLVAMSLVSAVGIVFGGKK